MAYGGKYKPKNPKKYQGVVTEIYYRSSWELSVMFWCDNNPKIAFWSSENTVIPYICPIDNKIHRYFIDLKIVFTNHETILVEIKPESQTKIPKKPKKVTKSYLKEVKSYIKNSAKWEAAYKYANCRNWKFQIWTEKTLKTLGIQLLTKFNK